MPRIVFRAVLAALLAASPALADAPSPGLPDPGCQFSYWAPGIVNQAEGTIELDVSFLGNRAALADDYQNLIAMSGNGGPGGSTSILSLLFAPPADGRDLSFLTSGPQGISIVDAPSPALEGWGMDKPVRVAVAWGGGEIRSWFNGVLLGRRPFRGPLAQLPEAFRVGYALDSGFPASFRVRALRISDAARPDAELAAPAPLAADAHTTLLADQDLSRLATPTTAWQRQEYHFGLFPVRRESPFVVPRGEVLKLPLRLVNLTQVDAAFTVHCAVRDRDGKEEAAQDTSLTIPAGTSYAASTLALPKLDATGYHEAVLTATGPDGRAATYEVGFAVQNRDTPAPGQLAGYLGHHHLFGIKADAFSQLGIRWNRAWNRERVFHWSVVEPVQGRFQWEAADRSLAVAKEQGVEVFGLLGYPPAWASTYSEAERERLGLVWKKNNARSPDRYQPRSLDEWKAYVRAVVSRYHDRVKYWEVYNEVDFHPPAMHATFTGSTQDYLALLQSVHDIVQEIDPSCRVLTAGFSLTKGITDYRMPLDLLKLGGASAFDVFNVHGYTDLGTLAETTEAVRAAKPGVPLWMSEYMYEQPGDDYNLVVKAFWFLAQGYERYVLHGGELDRAFGERKITPYYAVTAELARQLRPCDRYLGPCGQGEGKARSWKFRRSDGSWLNVFAVDNGAVTLTFGGRVPMTVTDLYGATLFRGSSDPAKPFEFGSLVYVTSPDDLPLARVDRRHGNVVVNGDFEKREGDAFADEAAARPVAWDRRAAPGSKATIRFVPGHDGAYALQLASLDGGAPIWTGQLVLLDGPGEWNLSADVKAPPGTKAVVILKQNQQGTWKEVIHREVAGTGDWIPVQEKAALSGENTKAVVLVGLLSDRGEVAVDNVKLILSEP